jgi:phage gpG-like protein
MDIQVTGVGDVVRAMRRVGRGCDDLDKAFKSVGDVVAARARTLAPRSTGRLASTIRTSRGGRYVSVGAGGASVPWAGVHEYGWARRNITAQPYLRPAVDASTAFAVKQLTDQVKDEIRAAGLD